MSQDNILAISGGSNFTKLNFIKFNKKSFSWHLCLWHQISFKIMRIQKKVYLFPIISPPKKSQHWHFLLTPPRHIMSSEMCSQVLNAFKMGISSYQAAVSHSSEKIAQEIFLSCT